MAELADGWLIDPEGWCPAARRVESPNFDARPPGTRVELIVIHNISLPPGCFGGDAIESLFTNCLNPSIDPYFRDISGLRVSSHFLIRRDGELVQFVSCNDRAWHAGASVWRGRERCNDFSIGIELEGSDQHAFEGTQYFQLEKLIDALSGAYPILDCKGHSEIATPYGRKTDPGPFFDWTRIGTLGRLS